MERERELRSEEQTIQPGERESERESWAQATSGY